MIRNFSDFKLTTITFGEILLLQTIKKLDLQHPTQRHSVWSIPDATKFIESIIERFPFEPIYIVKNKEVFSIIDGKQRLSTLLLFIGALEDDTLYKDKTKKKNQSICKNFDLSSDDLSDDFIDDYDIKKDDKINFLYLQDKIKNLSSLISALTFPCYILYEENKERGSESNVFELFRRINSSGVSIENGEIIQANLLQKENSQEIKDVIKRLEENLYMKEEFLPRKKIWEIFAKIAYINSKKEEFLSGNLDSINLDEEIEDFIRELERTKLGELIQKFIELNEQLEQFYDKKEKMYSFFNKSSNIRSKPENLYIYAILVKMLESKFTENMIDDIKNTIDSIQDKSSVFYYDEIVNTETRETKSKKMILKFDREPKKIKLGLFIANLEFDNYRNKDNRKLDNDGIRRKIMEAYFV